MGPARFVFLDETGTATNMTRRFGRSLSGTRPVAAVPHGRWRTATFMAGLPETGIVVPLVLDGLHAAGKIRRFTKDAKGCAALIAWLNGFPIARIALEPAGAYHHAFECRLAEAGLPLVKVKSSPGPALRRSDRPAGSSGRPGSRMWGTDPSDAAMLARFAALLEPPVRPVVSTTLAAKKELQVARRALVKDRVAAQNRSHRHRLPLLKRQAKGQLGQIDRQLAAIDAALRAQPAADAA